MALRNIFKEGSPILSKTCRHVEKFDDRLSALIDDMIDTLIDADGVGLAAPQVGILKRVAIVRIDDEEGVIELVNPIIVEKKGEQRDCEGCLSCPNQFGITVRPMWVKVKAMDRHGNEISCQGEGLKARALCHELDHLDGILFKQHVIKMLSPEEME